MGVRAEGSVHKPINLFNMASVQSDKKRPFVREILIDGADADACDFGDAISRDGLNAFALNDSNHRIEHGFNSLPRSALSWLAPDCFLQRFSFHRTEREQYSYNVDIPWLLGATQRPQNASRHVTSIMRA